MTVPLDPTNLIANVVSGNNVDLTWQDNAVGETGYVVERRDITSVLFHSDWLTGLGQGNPALFDTDKALPWNQQFSNIGAPGRLEVIAKTGIFDGPDAGFANCLQTNVQQQVAFLRVNRSGGQPTEAPWPLPQVGDQLFYRTYAYFDVPDGVAGAFGGNHPFEIESPNGSHNWSWKFGKAAGTDDLSLYFATSKNTGVALWWGGTLMAPIKSRTQYRLEARIQVVSTTPGQGNALFEADARVFDANGILIRSSSDFEGTNNQGPLSDHGPIQCDYTDWDNLSAGTNGGPFPSATYYWAGVCVRDDDWCGTYAGGV